MIYKKALAALRNCEIELRVALTAAAQQGDYNAVAQLTAWAQGGAGLAAEAGQLEDGALDGDTPTTPPLAPATKPVSRSARTNKMTYPRFARTEEVLVKIGWSKKAKSEYEHKAPVALAHQLTSAATKVGARGKVFSIEDLSSALAGADVSPTYQHYVVVAWWRDAGLIDQHGRKGYSIPKIGAFVANAAQRLDALPRHRS